MTHANRQDKAEEIKQQLRALVIGDVSFAIGGRIELAPSIDDGSAGWPSPRGIPAEAVKAGAFALYEGAHIEGAGMADVRRALVAAVPYIQAAAWQQGHDAGWDDCRAEDGQTPNPYTPPADTAGRMGLSDEEWERYVKSCR